jgi:hypothetical protein
MNIKQEKLFWTVCTIASYVLALYIVWCILFEPARNNSYIVHVIGMCLICYFTTSCLIQTYDYEFEANENNKKFKKDPHRGE